MSIFPFSENALLKRSLAAFVVAACIAAPASAKEAAKEAPKGAVKATVASAKAPEKNAQLVRVNATCQAYDFIRPWSKRAPYSHRGLGAVLAGNRVLVTAETIANGNYVELEKAESREKTVATVEVVDYEANLAILKPADENFLKGIKPLELKDAHVGDRVQVWQLENTGALLSTDGLLTTVEVGRYPLDDTALLTYRLTSSLQYREGSFTMPAVKDGKLIGMLMRYDAHSQNVELIPAPVIEHFLADAGKKEYRGFPRAGVLFSAMRDPQLRRYAGVKNEDTGGVYVTQVVSQSPGDKAGIQVGDVILAIGDKQIDQDGDYVDPQYGQLSLINLISAYHFDGDTVKFKIFRKGETKEVNVTLTHRPVEDHVIEPYTIGVPPKYYVLGGLVIQELSRQYLKEWGNDWYKKAPSRFVYLDAFQSELFPDTHKKIVFLSQVLPSPSTIGYEELSALAISKINDIPLNSIADVERAVKNPVNGFHKIEFTENPTVIYLDAAQVEKEAPEFMRNYGLPALKRLE